MKKLKRIRFSNGSEGYVDGNIQISISGANKVSEEEIELDDDSAKNILEKPVFYKIIDNKAILKDETEIPDKLKEQFKKIKLKKDHLTQESGKGLSSNEGVG